MIKGTPIRDTPETQVDPERLRGDPKVALMSLWVALATRQSGLSRTARTTDAARSALGPLTRVRLAAQGGFEQGSGLLVEGDHEYLADRCG